MAHRPRKRQNVKEVSQRPQGSHFCRWVGSSGSLSGLHYSGFSDQGILNLLLLSLALLGMSPQLWFLSSSDWIPSLLQIQAKKVIDARACIPSSYFEFVHQEMIIFWKNNCFISSFENFTHEYCIYSIFTLCSL